MAGVNFRRRNTISGESLVAPIQEENPKTKRQRVTRGQKMRATRLRRRPRQKQQREERKKKSTEEVSVSILNIQNEEGEGSDSLVDSTLILAQFVAQTRDLDLNASPHGLSP